MIRAASGEQDYDWAAQLMSSSEPWLTLQRDAAMCRAALTRTGSELFLADDDGERLGFVLLAEHGFLRAPYVNILAVAPASRNRGVGTELLRFAEQHFAGARHLFICVSSFNPDARRLYERVGYRQVGELPDFVVDGHSEFILHKRLP